MHRAWAHPRLAGRAIAWIGSRVCPSTAALSSQWVESGRVHVDESALEKSIFVQDFALPRSNRRGERPLHDGGGGRRRAPCEGARPDASQFASARVWCAEQAIRLGAAGIVVLDGTGLDHVMWRRLQLAAASTMRGGEHADGNHAGENHAGDETDARWNQESQRRAGIAGAPASGGTLVLVVTPPSVDGRASGRDGERSGRGLRRFHGASTIWRVHACVTEHGSRAKAEASGWSCIPEWKTPGCRMLEWRMKLVHARPKSALGASGEGRVTLQGAEEGPYPPGLRGSPADGFVGKCAGGSRSGGLVFSAGLHAGMADGRMAITVSQPCDVFDAVGVVSDAVGVVSDAVGLCRQTHGVHGAAIECDAFDVQCTQKARSA